MSAGFFSKYDAKASYTVDGVSWQFHNLYAIYNKKVILKALNYYVTL